MLGYRGHDDWTDMTEYLVHFVKEGGKRPPLPEDAHPHFKFARELQGDELTPYWVMLSVLWDLHLKPGSGTWGAARKDARLGDSQRAVCLAEVPLPFVGRIADRRESPYGLGFTQEFVRKHGGGRVWYLDKDEPLALAFQQTLRAHAVDFDADDDFWKLTPFVDVTGFFPSGGGVRPRRFEWEREWRVPGPQGLPFTPDDVAFLFIPEEQHVAARDFFDSYGNVTGPSFECPFIDPHWDEVTIQHALANSRATSQPVL
jgi:hypothetical protein